MARNRRKGGKVMVDVNNDSQRISSSESDEILSVDSNLSSVNEDVEQEVNEVSKSRSVLLEGESNKLTKTESEEALDKIEESKDCKETIISYNNDDLMKDPKCSFNISENDSISNKTIYLENVTDSYLCKYGNSLRTNKGMLKMFENERSLMPQDIQQIVLGDLKEVTVAQCEEVAVDNDEDINWEQHVIVENVICEDAEIDTESQITEDGSEKNMDGFESDYNVKVEADGYKHTKISDDEFITSTISVGDYDSKDVYEYSQGGSYEIITVSKEMDYENSQESESFDNDNEMEIECGDTIKAVLGVDEQNICSINISNDNSDDDDDNKDNKNLKISNNLLSIDEATDSIKSKLKLNEFTDLSRQSDVVKSSEFKENKVKDEKIDIDEVKDFIKSIDLEGDSNIAHSSKVFSDKQLGDNTGGQSDKIYYKTENDVSEEPEINSNIVDSTVSENKQVDSFTIFQNINAKKADIEELVLSSIDSDKSVEPSAKNDEEEKQPMFRSRSGSSDTTGSGSESGSTSSSGRRRSSRIKTVVVSKQGNEKSSCKSINPVTGSPVLAAPMIPGFDSDKPVKVKSRWRRSSELEMCSRVVSSDSVLTVSSTSAALSSVTIATTSTITSTPVTSTSADIADTTSNDAVPLLTTASVTTPTMSSPASSSTPQWSSSVEVCSPKHEEEVEEKLRTFIHIDTNEYLTGRSRSKETKRMVCDCFLTKEEVQRGEKGCGEDCLNRLLMIECGSRCVLGEKCTNKRFQNLEYVKSEVFKTKRKGYGLRSVEDIPAGTFILEYVGEVLDPKEFRRRAKEYAKDKNLHYYFMALKSDAIIDATIKGNNSRFINHSCDPNAETQKWTVNGELRIGFFSKRPIAAGEEITFDYQFQRYGKEAQRCYCESNACRGWIGEDPDKEGKWSDGSNRKERKEKKKKRDVRDLLNDMDLEEEIEKLVASGLKNRAHTLTLCRLMVRAEESESRQRLLKLLRHGDTACLRLFLDYHGLRLVWSWMMDSELDLKMEILETLLKLPIPNKTMLHDSKVLTVVEKWASADKNSLIAIKERKERSQSEDDSEAVDTEADAGSSGDSEKMTADNTRTTSSDVDQIDKTINKEDKMDCDKVMVDNDDETKTESEITDISSDIQKSDSTGKDLPNIVRFTDLASGLLAEWSSLKEVFRIPKKERIEQMKEHEREADRGYKERSRDSDKRDRHYDRWDRYSSDYDRRDRERERDRDRYRERDRDRDRKRSRESPDHERSSKRVDDKDKNGSSQRLSKNERRQLFMMKVEEEERQKKQQEEMWQQHQEQCLALGMDPNNTAAFNPQTGYPCFFDSTTQTWQPYPADANMQQSCPDGKMNRGLYPPPVGGPPVMFNPNQPLPYHDPSQPPPFVDTSQPPPFMDPNQPPPFVDTSQPPPFVDTSQPPPPFMDPNQGPYPPGAMYPMHPGPGFPIHDGSAQFPPSMPPPSQYGPPFQGPPAPFVPPSGYPSPVPQSQSFQTMPVGPPFQPPPQNYNSQQQFQPPLPQSPSNTQHFPHPMPQNPNDPSLQFQPPLPQGGSSTQNVNMQPQLSQGSDGLQAQMMQQGQGYVYGTTGTNATPGMVTSTDSSTGLPVYVATPAVPPPPPPSVRLPPKWKSAKDSEGRTYYYHVKTRVSQWEPPVWDQHQQPQPQQSDSSSDSDDDSDDESSSTSEDEEEEEEEKNEEEEEEDMEEEPEPEYDDPYLIEDDIMIDKEPDMEPSSMDDFNITDDSSAAKRKRDGLVQERIISPRTEFELEKTDKKKYREAKEKLKRQKAKLKEKLRLHEEKKHSHRHNKLKTSSKCEADTSSDPARKIKDNFRLNMAGVIVHYLNPYRKPDCKIGRITNTEDFKHLARKLTHFVMLKELKHCRSVDELECNDNVKHKARDFIKKYMAKFGSVYQRITEDD
ncbi:SET domain containing 2 [Lycorma delicatula]|uniref:SET domain containing 2 n=1 Tax=Lycorma delicatula TaxID=130591 RepID=UPI003F5150B7